MNQLALHYAHHADREWAIETDLRNRQLLDAAAMATAPTEQQVTATPPSMTATPPAQAPAPRPAPVRARAAGR